MNSEGQNITNVIKQVRAFFREAASMIRSADSLMSEHQWTLFTSYDLAHASGSQATSSPDNWMPYYLFRLFMNEREPAQLRAISYKRGTRTK